jgi:hypothetical protein
MILRECRDRLAAADIPTNQRPDLSDPKHLPSLSLKAWQAVMQMDQNSKTLPEKFRIQLDHHENALHVELPSADSIPTTPAGPGDDIDLTGEPITNGAAHLGAIEHLRAGQITIWPLPAVTRGPGVH